VAWLIAAIAILFVWVLWIALVIWTLVDNFGRRDHGGWAKAGWTVFIILVPLIGVLVYLIAKPRKSNSARARSPLTRPELLLGLLPS
jgi:hypothetical protein